MGGITLNKQGEDLEDALETTDLVCVNKECVTKLASRPAEVDNVTDLALVSGPVCTVCRVRSRTYEPRMQSFGSASSGQDIV